MPQSGDPRTQVSSFWIKVNGQNLPDDVFGRIAEVALEQDLVLPDAFLIRLHDVQDSGTDSQARFPTANGSLFSVGQSIEIGMGREEQPRSNLKGEVTSIDLEARADGVPLLTVRGYDKAHRLNRVKKTRSFENMSCSDIARRIAQENGLSPQVDSSGGVYTYLAQDSQTDWEFVRSLARKCGFEAFATGSQLYFRKPSGDQRAPEQNFGITLRQVRLRLSATAQADRVEVRAWNPKTKTALVGTASSPNGVAGTDQGKSGGRVATQAFGSAGKYVLNSQVVTSQTEAEGLAQSLLDEIAAGFVQLECTCLGDAELRPARSVNLKGLGSRFSKEYYISAATHRVVPDKGYLTYLTVSGRQPASLTALLGGNGHMSGPTSPAAGRAAVTHTGVVVGVVTNNKDPEMGGRIKVKFPWMDENIESSWARIASPLAGNSRGFYFLPEVNDEVLVAFEQGDVNYPYVIGYLWNGVDKVPKTANDVVGADGKIKQRMIKTTSGHTVILDDSPDSPSISIIDKTGNNKVHLDSRTNKLTITVSGDMDLLAQTGTINVKGQTVNVEATNALNMKGVRTQVQGTSTMNVQGAQTNVKGDARLGLDGGGMTEVKGGIIRLN